MRPDLVLIMCGTVGLHNVQKTQPSSSQTVIDLVALHRMPSRTLSDVENGCPFSLLATLSWHFAHVLRVQADIDRTPMQKGARKQQRLLSQLLGYRRTLQLLLELSPDRVIFPACR